MMPNQRPPMDLSTQNINIMLNGLRKNMSAIDGEITTMRVDAMSMLFNEFANVLNGLFQAKLDMEHKLKEHEATLEKIYQGHPDIQIAIEAEAAETKAMIDKKRVKIIKEQQKPTPDPKAQ
jgi:uncharacterized membrane protein (UPF0182 family)